MFTVKPAKEDNNLKSINTTHTTKMTRAKIMLFKMQMTCVISIQGTWGRGVS